MSTTKFINSKLEQFMSVIESQTAKEKGNIEALKRAGYDILLKGSKVTLRKGKVTITYTNLDTNKATCVVA